MRLLSISGAGGLKQHLRLSTLANGGVVPAENSGINVCRAHIGIMLGHEPTAGPQQLLFSHHPGSSPKLPHLHTLFIPRVQQSVSFTWNPAHDHHSKSSVSVHVSHLGFLGIFNENHLTPNHTLPLVRPPVWMSVYSSCSPTHFPDPL